jgi:hypothetical protein
MEPGARGRGPTVDNRHVRDPLIVSRLDGLVISSNNEFLAHIEDDEEIVVRSIADGSVVRRATVQNEGHTTLRAISPTAS